MTARRKPAVKQAAPRKPAAKTAAPQITNRYDAGGMGRRVAGWMPPSSGPNRALTNLQRIRDRSRDATRNDAAARSGIQHWSTNLIGTGIVPRLAQDMPKEKRKRYTKLWNDSIRQSDADGTLNFYGQLVLATKTWLAGGECFGRLRYRRPDSRLLVPLQLQLIEGDYVPMLDADQWPGMTVGNKIRSGIERTSAGQKVAVWVNKEHPLDNQSVNMNDLVRVPWSDMLQLMEPDRPGQLRGVPDFAAILLRLRNVADFDDAVLDRQKLANLFAAFIKRAPGSTFDTGIDPLTGKPISLGSNGAPMIALEPGLMQELMPGEEMQFSNPPEAGTTYSDYMRTQQMWTAAGQGLPYELMSGDIKDISDRTLRVVINEFRRFAEQRQWHNIIPQICQPYRDAWVDQAALAGLIDLEDVEAMKAVEWQPQGWPYIHPEQDVKAKALEIETGIRSRSSVISERGDDPVTVDEERASDKQREKDLDIAPEPPLAAGKKPGANAPADPNANDPQNKQLQAMAISIARLEGAMSAREKPEDASPIEHFIAGLTTLQASVATVAESVAALAARPIEIKNVVAPTPVEVHNNVNPTPVEVTNNVNPTPIEVTNNVNPTPVQITNEVPPAEVTVNLPDRKITSEITRENGQIVEVTQTETTLQ